MPLSEIVERGHVWAAQWPTSSEFKRKFNPLVRPQSCDFIKWNWGVFRLYLKRSLHSSSYCWTTWTSELYLPNIISFSVANFRRASHIVSHIVDLHPEDGQEDIKEALQIAANAHGLPTGSLGTINTLRKHIFRLFVSPLPLHSVLRWLFYVQGSTCPEIYL